MLTLKLTMLLCLVTAQQSQTLHLLKLSNMISEGQNIIFTILDLLKQSSVRIKAPIIKLRPYADKALCVTTALHEYLSRTKDLQKQVDNLINSYARPDLAVTKNTISRWIKSMLEIAGIDISIYKSHIAHEQLLNSNDGKFVPSRRNTTDSRVVKRAIICRQTD